MVPVFYHEHPRQAGRCLPGAFDAYVKRIPVASYSDLSALWQDIRRRPFEPDGGPKSRSGEAKDGPGLCSPAQRSRVWPERMNCWEATAHFVAGGRCFLPKGWALHVWDRDLPNGARHVWPSLTTPRGDHLLVDLNSTAERTPTARMYSGLLLPDQAANAEDVGAEVGKDILGGIHVVGGGILKAFGLGDVAKKLEEVEGDALPDFARSAPAPESKRKKKPSLGKKRRRQAKAETETRLFGPGSL